ncbi:MAG: hypothetical protein RLZZ546_2978, partial [Bacteroidota bacterium]
MGSIIFILILGFVIYKSYFLYSKIYNNIRLGKDENISGHVTQRWKNVFLIAFGQRKMFQNWIPAIFHLFIYVAFLFTQVELIEILIDGIFSTHRFFASMLGMLYTFIISFIEVLSLLAFIATIIFLWRRNLLKVPRLVKSELNGWPKLDANIILIVEILLIFAIFTMNSADSVLQVRDPENYHDAGRFLLSAPLGNFLFSDTHIVILKFLERFGWWMHTLIVFGMILYLPISKHLHIFLSFPNVYFSNFRSRGEMTNMPEVMNEVKSMLGLSDQVDNNITSDIPQFGAKDVMDLSWKNILDAYSCTECGRCTSQCPANITGKKLSPRKIMMDVRDRATEIGDKIFQSQNETLIENRLNKENFDDSKNLFSYISKEEIRACTTCNACVEACPILINPLDIILQLRRYEVLTESSTAEEWTPMFT